MIKSLKISFLVATAALSIGAVAVPAHFVPAAIQAARANIAAVQSAAQSDDALEGTARPEGMVRTFSPDPSVCNLLKGSKIAGRSALVRSPMGHSPECAFPIAL